jgi:hypothetical protein
MSDTETNEAGSLDDRPPEQRGWRAWRWDLISRVVGVVGAAISAAIGVGLALLALAIASSGLHVDWEFWVVSPFFVGMAILLAVTSRPKPKVRSPQDRIKEVVRHLESTGRLLRDLEDDLATRTKVLQQLQQDAERYEKLIGLNAEQAKAIDDMVGRQLKQQAKEARLLWIISLVLAVVFGFVVNWFSTPLLNWFTN